MKRILFAAGLAAVLPFFSGCNNSSTPGTGTAATGTTAAPVAVAAAANGPVDPDEPTQAQPKLRTMKLWLGAEEMAAELCLNQTQMRAGMMFRTNMEENAGMLFVFPRAHQAGFWMKNTFVPLSGAYIDPEGVIREIHPMQPHDTNTVLAATDQIQYVLETPQGWFDRHHVKTGMVVRTEMGTLRKTFFSGQ